MPERYDKRMRTTLQAKWSEKELNKRRTMESVTLGITRRDKKRNDWIGKQTGITVNLKESKA